MVDSTGRANLSLTVPGAVESASFSLDSMFVSLDAVSVQPTNGLSIQAYEDREVRYSIRHRIDSDFFHQHILLVGINSDFGRSVDSMLVVPHSQPDLSSHMVNMIVRPVDPTIFCIDQRITYVQTDMVPAAGHRRADQQLGMYSSVKIVGDDFPLSNDQVSFLLVQVGTTGRSSIPHELYDRLVTMIRANGGSIIREDGRRYISALDCFESMTSVLPAIEFSVLDSPDPSTTRLNLLFRPDEYLAPVPNNPDLCLLLLRPRLRIPQQPYNTIQLDLDFIKRLVIHCDYVNQQIGFGDPL